MKSKKVLLIILMILTLLPIFTIKSYAADTFSATLTPSSQKVNKGEEFTVTLKLENINVQDGISVVGGTLKYNSDILTIKDPTNDVKGIDKWVMEYNEENSAFSIDTSEAVSEDTEIATFKFVVNEDTTETMASVTIANMKAGNASISQEVEISDVITNISIGTGTIVIPTTSPSESPSESPSITPSESPSESPSIVPSTTPSEEPTAPQPTTTVKEEDIPSTGTENFVIPLIIVIVSLGVVSFIGYKKMDK